MQDHQALSRAEETDDALTRLFNPSSRNERIEECVSLMGSAIPPAEASLLQRCRELVQDLYQGNFSGYRACNTGYHDLPHTWDVFVASVRLCDGALSKGIRIDPVLHSDICIAALLHDTGYIQEDGDGTGTGAKYTSTHVNRSMAFTRRHRDRFGLSPERAERICRLIDGTNLATDISAIPFESGEEAFACNLLASADLLGQMADRTYLEKLLFLYYEFREAGFPGYETEFDILRKTLCFYEMTKKRLLVTLENATDLARWHFLARYGVNRNLYLESIERQMDYLRSIIDDDSVNFRKKLKRLDLEAVSASHAIA